MNAQDQDHDHDKDAASHRRYRYHPTSPFCSSPHPHAAGLFPTPAPFVGTVLVRRPAHAVRKLARVTPIVPLLIPGTTVADNTHICLPPPPPAAARRLASPWGGCRVSHLVRNG
jgi:hypothetical protein